MEHPTRLTIAQAARELGMSERTLRRRVTGGKIEGVKETTPETGSAWFIEQATVDALLREQPRRQALPSGAAPPAQPLDAAPLDVAQLKGGAPLQAERWGEEEEEENKEDVAALVRVEPEQDAQAQSAEVVQLRADVQQIKAFLMGQAMAESGAELPANLGTVIGQAMRETLAPLVEKIEQQSAENALLKKELAEAEARELERKAAQTRRRPWWPFSHRPK